MPGKWIRAFLKFKQRDDSLEKAWKYASLLSGCLKDMDSIEAIVYIEGGVQFRDKSIERQLEESRQAVVDLRLKLSRCVRFNKE